MKAIYDLMKSNNIKTITEKYTHNINELDKHLNASFFSKLLRKISGNDERIFHTERHFSFDNKENSFIHFDSYRTTTNESFITSDKDRFAKYSKNCYEEYFINEEDKIYKTKRYSNREYSSTTEYYTGEFIYVDGDDYTKYVEIEEEEYCKHNISFLKITYDNNGNPKEIYSRNENKYSIGYLSFSPEIVICKYNDRNNLSDCIYIFGEDGFEQSSTISNTMFKLVLNYDNTDIPEISIFGIPLGVDYDDMDIAKFSVFGIPLDNIDAPLLNKCSFPFSDDHLIIKIKPTNPNIWKALCDCDDTFLNNIERKEYEKIEQDNGFFLFGELYFPTIEFYEHAKKLYNGNTTRCLSSDSKFTYTPDFPKLEDNSTSSNSKYTYQNDSRGNWIKKTGFINNKQVVIAERTIEYYD